MKINGVVQRKLALLDSRIIRLEGRIGGVSRAEFVDDWVNQAVAERQLQVMVEIIIDIAERLIAIHGAGPVPTAGEAIRRLVDLKIIESESPYVDMVRFRNLIVHQYEEIDPNILFSLATTKLQDFRRFRDEIDRHICA